MRNYWGWTAEQRNHTRKSPFKRRPVGGGRDLAFVYNNSAPETFAKGIGNLDKRPFSAWMGSRPKLLISRLFWGGLGREVHPNSSYCRSVTLENRAWTLAEPDGGKFLSPGMKARGRTRFGSHLQGLFLFFIHIKEKKCGHLSSSAWTGEYLNIALY